MKLSERLISETENLWIDTSCKRFLADMARGSLDADLYKKYMMQDYLYLVKYIELQKKMLAMNTDEELGAFFERIIRDTEYETYRVHIPSLRALGITDEDLRQCEMGRVIADYIAFMKRKLEEKGVIAGITALLQCSWNYAYIANAVAERYPDAVSKSPYKGWFDAYTGKDYAASNQLWIDLLDKKTKGISNAEAGELCAIFITCAEYENKLWDYFDQKSDLSFSSVSKKLITPCAASSSDAL